MRGNTTMDKDDEDARNARAETLMQEIERLTSQSPANQPDSADETTDEGDTGPKPPLSPREFIRKRMQELDRQEKSRGKK